MRSFLKWGVAIATLLCTPPTYADKALGPLKKCGSGKVAQVTTGDRFTLSTGEKLVMADMKAPEYWPSSSEYNSWPHSHKAKQALTELLLDQHVDLLCDRKPHTVFGDKRAHVIMKGGTWLQQHLIREGNAFYFPTETRTEIRDVLRHTEKEARHNKLGMWANKSFWPTSAAEGNQKTGWFQFVEGNVREAATVGKTTYLNFGNDWRTDFTVQLDARLTRQLKKRSLQVEALNSAHIEVRGWVEWSGGPKIVLNHLDQLEILSVSKSR